MTVILVFTIVRISNLKKLSHCRSAVKTSRYSELGMTEGWLPQKPYLYLKLCETHSVIDMDVNILIFGN
jgi:hypothetical protein